MSRDSTVIPFRQPDAIDDPLTELAREGARRMLSQALIAEADAFVAMWKDLKLPDGRDRVVRHGHGPQRAIQTGVGPVEVRRAKVRETDKGSPVGEDRQTHGVQTGRCRREGTNNSVGRDEFVINAESNFICCQISILPVEIFDLCRPVRCEGLFDAATHDPAVVGI